MKGKETQVEERFVSAREVCRITGLSRSSLWRYQRASNFPRHRRLGPRRVGWLLSEVQAWMKSREVAA